MSDPEASPTSIEISLRPVPEDSLMGRPAADPQPPTAHAHASEGMPPAHPQPTAEDVSKLARAAPPATLPPPKGAIPAELKGPATLDRPPATVLLPPDEPLVRSKQLECIARQADQQIRRGFGLAGRRAYFAARAEFVKALRLVAQGLDTERQTTTRSRALAAALKAIKEAEDFIPQGSRLEADLDIAGIIAGHCTPVLKDADTEKLTPLLALQCYFTFAQEQFAAAVGHEVAGSMALHALGKVHAAMARNKVGDVAAAEPKAMLFYQAALLVNPNNYMAANDLGVLLAQSGSYADAQAAIVRSLSIHPQSAGWQNLAVVYYQLGQPELAYWAQQQAAAAHDAEIARQRQLHSPSQQWVYWVDPGTFANANTDTQNAWESAPPRPAPAEAKQEPKPPTPPPQAPQSTTADRWPWNLQQRKE